MASRVAALLLVQLIALAASAQEFGRATSGEIAVTTKSAAPFSGSIAFSQSSSDATGYGLTAGGTLMKDRIWFFAAASRQEGTRFANFELPESATTSAAGARIHAQMGASHDFSAFFEAAKRPQFTTTPATPSTFTGIAPTSLFSLRYTGVVSSNMLFSASFTRSKSN